MPQSCNLHRPNQPNKNAACQFALIGLLGCPMPPTDVGCPPRPMPCGVDKPPTRLLVLIERMPMARQRPALDSTGTAPDRRQPLPNFNSGCQPAPAHQPALCLFTATRPARPHGCAGTFLRTPPLLPTGATVSRYTHPLQNRLASVSSFYGSNLTLEITRLRVGKACPNHPYLCRQITIVKTGCSNSRALICWAALTKKLANYKKLILNNIYANNLIVNHHTKFTPMSWCHCPQYYLDHILNSLLDKF